MEWFCALIHQLSNCCHSPRRRLLLMVLHQRIGYWFFHNRVQRWILLGKMVKIATAFFTVEGSIFVVDSTTDGHCGEKNCSDV